VREGGKRGLRGEACGCGAQLPSLGEREPTTPKRHAYSHTHTLSLRPSPSFSDPTCDIVLAPREISRRHARLQVRPGGRVWVSSLGKEPVCVGGVPVPPGGAPVLLPPGAAVQVKLAASVREIRYEAPEVTVSLAATATPRAVLGELQAPPAAGRSRLAAASPVARKPAPVAAPPAADEEDEEMEDDQENAPVAAAAPAAAKPAPAAEEEDAASPAQAPPRKSVRFAATPAGAGSCGGAAPPLGTPASGHPVPASVDGGAVAPPSGAPGVVDVRGDDTAAFRAWAAGDGEGPAGAPPGAAAAPPLSVGTKRRSCSGSRLGTPAVRSSGSGGGGGGADHTAGARAAGGRRRSSTRAAAAAVAAAITLAAEEAADAAMEEGAPARPDALLALPAPPLVAAHAAAAAPSVVRTVRLSAADATVELPAALFASPAAVGAGTVSIVVPAALAASGDVEIRIPAVSLSSRGKGEEGEKRGEREGGGGSKKLFHSHALPPHPGRLRRPRPGRPARPRRGRRVGGRRHGGPPRRPVCDARRGRWQRPPRLDRGGRGRGLAG